LKFLGLESWPPSARKVPILANFEADLKKKHAFFGPGLMRDVYLGFRRIMAYKNCRQNVDTREMVTI
jgi:hypothetical protein